MFDPGGSHSVGDLIANASLDAQPFADTVLDSGVDTPAVIAALELGLPMGSASAGTNAALDGLRAYRNQIGSRDGSGWMDNTTILTAATLMTDAGPEAMTPLTVWDLVTFTQAAISYEHIYHHEHHEVNDAEINRWLGGDILRPIPLPEKPPGATSPLPDPWNGPHRFMCEVWGEAFSWLKRLSERVDTPTLDGSQLAIVREAWSLALARPDLSANEIVDWKHATSQWTSPSNTLLREMVDATSINDTAIWIDPAPEFEEFQRLQVEAGVRPIPRGRLLTDLNLRAYINQRLADFFGLPYICAAARVPFRKHLYDRAVAVQQRLTAVKLLDDRYAEVAEDVRLRLPVFLAIAIRRASEPNDLWSAVAKLRGDAKPYRARRSDLDAALARGDLKEVKRLAKALTTDVDSILTVAGKAVATASMSVVEEIAKGDVTGIASGVAAAEAVGKGLLASSVADRVMWRLRRPHLLWINDVMDEAKHLTEALPDFTRVWQIPEREQSMFLNRFPTMGALQQLS
jgi:hypothetical protein